MHRLTVSAAIVVLAEVGPGKSFNRVGGRASLDTGDLLVALAHEDTGVASVALAGAGADGADPTTYCKNRIAMLALTSAIYLRSSR